MRAALDPEERLLISCGKVSFHARDRDRCQEALARPFKMEKFLELCRRHKVVPEVVQNLTVLATTGPIPAAARIIGALLPDYEARRDWIENAYEPELLRLSAALTAAGIDHAFTKGAHLLPLYPDPGLRELRDVDVLVKDVRQLFKAYDVLHELGYCLWFKYENPWLAGNGCPAVSDTERTTGHIVFSRFLTTDHKISTEGLDRVQVEIYSSGQTAGIGHLESGIWGRLGRDGRGLMVPSLEDALLILVAHNVKHGEYFLKDLNDIYLICATHGPGLDWDYVIATARGTGLDGMGALMFMLVNDYYDKPTIDAGIIRDLDGGRGNKFITEASFRFRNSAHLSSASLQAPMVWARHSSGPLLSGIAGSLRELGEFVAGLPLEYETSRFSGAFASLWRRFDRRRWPLGTLAGRLYLIPIACLVAEELRLDRLLASSALDGYEHRQLLEGLLVQVEVGTCRLVLGRDYVFLPTVIPYKPSRAILGARVADHIMLAKALLSEFRQLGLLQDRQEDLNWYPSQVPFAAVSP